MTVIHAYVYDPARSVFKTDTNVRAQLYRIHCSEHDRCEVYSRGQCICRGVLSSCPHGRESVDTGWTRRARKYGAWIQDAKAKTKDIPSLQCAPSKMARVGDYLYIPYAYMEMFQKSIWTRRCFLPVEQFTVDLIVGLVAFRPHAWMGGEIRSYQTEEVPSFVSHLQELYPEMLAEAAEKSEHLQNILRGITKVGRKALLRTVLPNVGSFREMHNGSQAWVWDGTHMSCTDKSDMPPFTPFGAQEMRILPGPDAAVEITDDAQVGKNTQFLD